MDNIGGKLESRKFITSSNHANREWQLKTRPLWLVEQWGAFEFCLSITFKQFTNYKSSNFLEKRSGEFPLGIYSVTSFCKQRFSVGLDLDECMLTFCLSLVFLWPTRYQIKGKWKRWGFAKSKYSPLTFNEWSPSDLSKHGKEKSFLRYNLSLLWWREGTERWFGFLLTMA